MKSAARLTKETNVGPESHTARGGWSCKPNVKRETLVAPIRARNCPASCHMADARPVDQEVEGELNMVVSGSEPRASVASGGVNPGRSLLSSSRRRSIFHGVSQRHVRSMADSEVVAWLGLVARQRAPFLYNNDYVTRWFPGNRRIGVFRFPDRDTTRLCRNRTEHRGGGRYYDRVGRREGIAAPGRRVNSP